MKANELRIGNWVMRYKKPLLLDIDEMEVLLGGRWFEELEPIPLTPVILGKAGFRKFGANYLLWFNESAIEFDGDSLFLCLYGDCSLEFRHIKHLHQLQNLYFALTREELNIEL